MVLMSPILTLLFLFGICYFLYQEQNNSKTILSYSKLEIIKSSKGLIFINEKQFHHAEGQEFISELNGLFRSYKGAFADIQHVLYLLRNKTQSRSKRFHRLQYLILLTPLVATASITVVTGISGNEPSELDILLFVLSIVLSLVVFGVFRSLISANLDSTISHQERGIINTVTTKVFPSASHSMLSGFDAVQHSMSRFSESTENQLNRLESMLVQQSNIIGLQHDIIEKVQATDLTDLARTQLDAFLQLEKLAAYYHTIQEEVTRNQEIITTWTDLSERSGVIANRLGVIEENVSGIGADLRGKLEIANQLLLFFESHMKAFGRVDEQVQESTIRIHNLLDESLRNMRDMTNERISSIREITIKEDDMMSKAFASNKENLNELKRLEVLEQSVSRLDRTLHENGEKLTELVGLFTELNKKANEKKGGLFGGLLN